SAAAMREALRTARSKLGARTEGLVEWGSGAHAAVTATQTVKTAAWTDAGATLEMGATLELPKVSSANLPAVREAKDPVEPRPPAHFLRSAPSEAPKTIEPASAAAFRARVARSERRSSKRPRKLSGSRVAALVLLGLLAAAIGATAFVFVDRRAHPMG